MVRKRRRKKGELALSIAQIVIATAFIALSLIVTVVPLIYGEVKKLRVIKPVEYLPPCGSSPIDILIEYYGATATPREIFNPLMLYWASRGFITIEEDCKRGLRLIKLKDIEPPESADGFNPETFELEKKLFNYIFSGKKKNFYTLTAFHTFKNTYYDVTKECMKQAKKVTAEKSKKFLILSCVASVAALLFSTLLVGISVGTMAMIMVFPIFAMCMAKGVLSMPEESGLEKGTAMRFFILPFFGTAGGIPFAVMLTLVPLEAAIILSVATAVCLVNLFFLSAKIDIRTDEQLKTYAKICGFKKFLLSVEVKQLEALVESDPQYFYNILPYCYVLKITKKLKPKFDRFALDGPAWYLGELRDVLMF